MIRQFNVSESKMGIGAALGTVDGTTLDAGASIGKTHRRYNALSEEAISLGGQNLLKNRAKVVWTMECT